MHAIRASLRTRLAAAAVVAVVATGGAIAAAAATGAVGGSHQKPRVTALSVKHRAMRSQQSCERDDQVASRETASRDDDAGRPNQDEAEGSCSSGRSERLGDSVGRNDREDAAEANGNRDRDMLDETQQHHQASGQD